MSRWDEEFKATGAEFWKPMEADCRLANHFPDGDGGENLWGKIVGQDGDTTYIQTKNVALYKYAWGDIARAGKLGGRLTAQAHATEEEIRQHVDRLKTVIPAPNSLQYDLIRDFAGPIYYCSGHLDLTEDEFQEHYVPLLDEALGQPGSRFVVGDARGADAMCQSYLEGKADQVIVFHMMEKPRNNCGHPTMGGYTSDKQRDAAMTSFSTHDIAWVRPGRENSGTAKNLARRNMTEEELQAEFRED